MNNGKMPEMKTGERMTRSAIVIASLAIALMFVVSLPFVLNGDENGHGDADTALGADATVTISNTMSIEDIAIAIQDELDDNVVTIVTVTGSKTAAAASESGNSIYLDLKGKSVIWEADIEFDCFIWVEGEGSFTAGAECSMTLASVGSFDGATMTINCDVTLGGSSSSYSGADDDGTTNFNGNVTFRNGNGLEAGDGSIVTVGKNLTFEDEGCYIQTYGESIMTITGDVSFEGDRCYIQTVNGGTISITGNVSFEGIYSNIGSADTVTVIGNVSFGDRCYIQTFNGGAVSITGNVSFEGDYSYIDSADTVTVIGNVSFGGYNCYIQTVGGTISITGNVSFDGKDSFVWTKGGSIMTITGNILFNDETCSMDVFDGSAMTVTGNVTFIEEGGWISAHQTSKLEITGKLTANANVAGNHLAFVEHTAEVVIGSIETSGSGINTSSKVTVTGNVNAEGEYAVFCNGGEVLVKGNVIAENSGILISTNGGTVTVNGNVTADPGQYIGFRNGSGTYEYVQKDSYTGTEDGYYVYDGSDAAGNDAFVYIKIPVDNGGSNLLIIAAVVIAIAAIAGIAYYFLVMKKK